MRSRNYSKRNNMHRLALMVCVLMASSLKISQAQVTLTVTPTWLEDEEDFTTISKNENRFQSYKAGAENLGLTFAGRVEYPWIVDIRMDHISQSYWSVGSLIRDDTVFTCCRCIILLGNFETSVYPPRVYFCPMHVNEYVLRNNPADEEWLVGGSRLIKSVEKHSDCSVQDHLYNGGIITLAQPIQPSPPTITLMPISINYANGKIPEVNLENMKAERRICYVASFGRQFYNIKDHLTLDFKVKYRVYYEKMELCRENNARLCPNVYLSPADCLLGADNSTTTKGLELMCFQARAKVGVVCDHDKGAPLVCDGIVFGLVVLGARKDQCNDLLQVPFYVQKISMFKDYFQAKEETKRTGKSERSKERSSVESSFIPNKILLLVATIAFGLKLKEAD